MINDFKEKFFGIVPPLVTPFDENGDIDYDLFRQETKRILNTGVSGISVGGSTGEGHTLTVDELQKLSEIAVEEANGKFFVIGGIISDSTRDAIKKGNVLKQAGVDALMITPVHYLFNSGDAGIYDFYREIHIKTNMPIIVYNVVPWNMATPEILEKLANDSIIFAVKQSAGDIHSLGALLAAVGKKLPIMTAIDDMMFPSFVMGAVGSICAINTPLPITSVKLYNYVKAGEFGKAKELHERILPIARKILLPDMPARIKFVMNNAGWNVGLPRKPILNVDEKTKEELMKVASEVKKMEVK